MGVFYENVLKRRLGPSEHFNFLFKDFYKGGNSSQLNTLMNSRTFLMSLEAPTKDEWEQAPSHDLNKAKDALRKIEKEIKARDSKIAQVRSELMKGDTVLFLKCKADETKEKVINYKEGLDFRQIPVLSREGVCQEFCVNSSMGQLSRIRQSSVSMFGQRLQGMEV